MTATDVELDTVAFDELNSSDARALFDTVDDLRELQIGEIVNLPQIIVVGDQSSGKSSVLEAISRVRFPTRGDLCTRFATELVLRRGDETKISVSIDKAPGPGSEPESDPESESESSPTSGPSPKFKVTSFRKDDLPRIINEAMESMGIRAGGTKDFSKEILRVKITDPHIYPVTLVDLPGFFHSETSDQTQEGKEIVRQLAERYMKQPKSIILAVVSANHNLANQIVVEEAKKYDPKRERTLGIITKPDLAAPGSQDERKCLQLVRGQEKVHQLKLGWHVLRNRPEGQENITTEARDAAEEQFFEKGAWSSIISSSRGVTQLRKKLSKVLLTHIQKTLPGLVQDIESKLIACQQKLHELGKSRSQPGEQRTYLLDIAQRFHRLAEDGVKGRYDDDFFGDLYSDHEARKLRAFLRRLNLAFYSTLRTKGVACKVEWDAEDESYQSDEGSPDGRNQSGEDRPEYLQPFLNFFEKFQEPVAISEHKLWKELEGLAARNQGSEFPGLHNANLAFQFFKKQAEPWEGIAKIYLERAVGFARKFVQDLLTHIIRHDEQTKNALLLFCVDAFFKHKQKILEGKLEEILRPFKSAYGPPLEDRFLNNMASLATRKNAERVASLIEEKLPSIFTDRGGGRRVTPGEIEDVIRMADPSTTIKYLGAENVFDMAMTHFQLSQTTFAENVVNLVLENCLISDLPNILTPQAVVRMDEERLQQLASESDEVEIERENHEYEERILKKGLERCQRYRQHKKLVLPAPSMNSQAHFQPQLDVQSRYP